jgi:hypothetical protein
MSATYIGYEGTDLMPESSWEQNKEGLITYTEKNMVLCSVGVVTPALTATRNIGGQILRAVAVNVVSSGGAFKEITVTYQGQEGLTLQQDSTSSTGEEPIESNKYFFNGDIGGGSSIVTAAGASNVIYNDDGSFAGFTKNAQRNFFGVTSYLNPNLVYRRSFTTSVTASATNLSAVGRIVTPTDDFPTAIAGATWLCVGVSYVKRGQAFDVTQDFRASGEQGWNIYIYGTAVTAPPLPTI